MARRVGYNVAVFALGFGACAVTLHAMYGAPFPGQPVVNSKFVLAALQRPVPEAAHNPDQITLAARAVTPAVVTIDTTTKPIQVNNPMMGDPFFRQFFGGGGGMQPQTRQEEGIGSGIMISPDGYILTNDHVIDNAATIKVTLSDGKAYRGRLIGTDRTTDIAVIKLVDVPATQMPLPYAQLGDSKDLEVGDPVIAVGDPLDVGTTVTSGIISALGHRNQGAATGVGSGRQLASDIIQTDAAINPGNSGGALADLSGKVIAINEAIASSNGGFSGIGFAIPIDTARTIAEQLIQTGEVIRPYVGIGYMPLKGVDVQSRQQLGITDTGDDGAIVVNVYPNSPAADAGLQQYDIITQANRQPITSDSGSLQAVINKLKPGDRLVLLVNRGGQQKLVAVTVKQMPKNFGADQDSQQGQSQGQGGDQGQSQGGDQGQGSGDNQDQGNG